MFRQILHNFFPNCTKEDVKKGYNWNFKKLMLNEKLFNLILDIQFKD